MFTNGVTRRGSPRGIAGAYCLSLLVGCRGTQHISPDSRDPEPAGIVFAAAAWAFSPLQKKGCSETFEGEFLD